MNSVLLNGLDPRVAAMGRAHLVACEKEGIVLHVTQGLRTMAEQTALYEQGRNGRGHIVTNAKAGQSFHNYGLAYDVCPSQPNGAFDWSTDGPAVARWQRIGALGKALGLRWGGDFHSIKDLPHFEWSGSLTLHDLEQGKRP